MAVSSVRRRWATIASRTSALVSVFAALSGCAAVQPPLVTQQVARGEVPIVLGAAVRDNVTPMEGVLACFGDWVAATGKPPVVVGVGDVKDYTGKYSINEGNAITQGGALMVYSALGKLGGAVAVAERFDPSVAERELGYIDRRQLGDGEEHRLSGANGVQDVPWLPYFGGTIQKSDYFIVGGITEVNYNIASGGGEIGVNQVGAKRRTYNESVSIDLRIVNTKTLMVEKTVSLTKQFTGYEVDANIFRFFGSNLWDVDIGAKGQEPLQLGIRTAMEEGVVRLVSAVTHVDYRPCMDQLTGRVLAKPAETMRQRANPAAKASSQADAKAERPVNAAMNTVGRIPGGGVQIAFEFGSADLDGRALTILDQIAAQAKKGGAEVMLVSHDTENLDPGKRDTLLNQRIAAVTAALTSRGVAAGAVQVVWRPDPADTAIHRDGPGMQELAKLKIGG